MNGSTRQGDNKAFDEQLKSISPEAMENVQRAGFLGGLNFIKSSPLKYFYIFVGIVILVGFIVTIYSMVGFSAEKSGVSDSVDRVQERQEEKMDDMREQSDSMEEGQQGFEQSQNEALDTFEQQENEMIEDFENSTGVDL